MTEKTPGRSLEDMSKHELIGQMKKQFLLLKKTKQKMEDLSKKCSALEEQRVEENLELQSQSKMENLKKDYEDSIACNLQLQQDHDNLLVKYDELNETFQNECKRHEENLHTFGATQEQIDCMKMKMETMDSSFQCLQDEVASLQTTLQEKEKIIDELTSEKSNLMAENESLKSQANSHDEVLPRYEIILADLKVLEGEKKSLCVQVQDEQERTVQLIEDYTELQDWNKSTINEFQQLVKTHETLRQEHDECKHINALKNDLRELRNLKSENRDLCAKLEALESETMDKVTEIGQLELETELGNKISEIKFLQDRVASLLPENKELQQEILQDRELIRFLEDEANSLSEENKKVKADMSALEDEVEKDARQIAEFDLKLHDMQDREQQTLMDLANLRDKEELTERIQVADDHAARLEVQRNLLDSKVAELEETIERLVYSSPKRRSAIFSDDETDSVDECRDEERNRYRAEMMDLRKRAQEANKMEKDIEHLKRMVEHLNDKISEFQDKERLILSRKTLLNEELLAANRKNEELQSMMKELEEASNLQELLRESRSANEELKDQMKLLQDQRDVLYDRVDDLEQKIDDGFVDPRRKSAIFSDVEDEEDECSDEERQRYKDEISSLRKMIIKQSNLMKKLQEDVSACENCQPLDVLKSLDSFFNEKASNWSEHMEAPGHHNDMIDGLWEISFEAVSKELQTKNGELLELNEMLKEEVTIAKKDNECLKVVIEEKQVMVVRLHEQLDDWMGKNEELASLLDDRQMNISYLESQLVKLQDDKDTLESESKALKDRMNELIKTERHFLELQKEDTELETAADENKRSFVKAVEDVKHHLDDDFNNLKAAQDVADDALQEKENLHADVEDNINILESKIRQLESDVSEMDESRKALQETIDAEDILKNEKNRLEDDFKALNKRNETIVSDFNNLKLATDIAEDALQEKERLLDLAEENIRNLDCDKLNFEKRMNEALQETIKMENSFKCEKSRLEDDFKALTERHDEILRDFNDLESAKEVVGDALQEKESLLTIAEETIRSWDSKNRQLESDMSEMRESHKALQETIESEASLKNEECRLEDNFKALIERHDNVLRDFKDLELAKEVADDALQEKENLLSVAEENIRNLGLKNHQLEGDVREKRAFQDVFQQTIETGSSLEIKKRHLEDDLKALNDRHEEILSNFENLKLTKDVADDTLQERERLLALAEENIHILESKIWQMESDASKMRDSNDVLQKKMKDVNEAEDLWKIRLASFEEQLLEIEKEKETLQKERENLEEELKALQLTCDRLTDESEGWKSQNWDLSVQLGEVKLSLDNSKVLSSDFESKFLERERANVELRTELGMCRRTDEDVQQRVHDEYDTKLKDAEVKLVKVRTFAVKAKKELAETKQKLTEITAERDQLLSKVEHLNHESSSSLTYLHNYQSLQAEYDKAQDKIEEEKSRCKNFEQDLHGAVFELSNLKLKHTVLTEQKQRLLAESDKCSAEKSSLMTASKELEATIMCLEEERKREKKKHEALQAKLDKANTRIEDMIKQLKEEKKQSALINEKFNVHLQESKKLNLIDLEIADYEKTVSSLQTEIHVKNCNIQELTGDNQYLQDRISSLQEQIKCLEVQKCDVEAHGERMKDLLEKSKKELAELIESSASERSENASLQVQLEGVCQQVENHKVEISQLAIEKRTLEETNEVLIESHHAAIRSADSKLQLLQSNLKMVTKEKDACQRDYECYKTRVHNVYKQQKQQSGVANDNSKEMEKRLQEIVDQLKAKLEEVGTKLASAKCENETLQTEFDLLLERNTQVSKKLENSNTAWMSKLEIVLQEKDQIIFANKDVISCLQAENEKLCETHKSQVVVLVDEHKQNVARLQKQLDIAEDEITRLQRWNIAEGQQQQQKLQNAKEEETVADISLQERQEGEGSECTEIHSSTPQKSTSLPLVHSTGFLPLEQLIEPLSPTVSFSSSMQETEVLSDKLSSSMKKIEHLSEVLSEAEQNSMRLSEQTIVLKQEIRRLERNREREEHSENLEYMKNVILKYMTIPVGDEKLRLVPVLTTMLRLSHDERQCLQDAAGGELVNSDQNPSASWGNLLHRWSGLS